MTIVLLGSTGLLGSTLGPFLSSRGYQVITHSRSQDAQCQADVSSLSDTYTMLETIRPEIILNLVGLTDVDLCETNPNLAYLSNVRTVENISHWMRHSKAACHLIHISTDQVYDSAELHPEENVTLTNYYGFSKYAGELAAASVPSTIFRTNFFGRSRCTNRSSLTDWIFRSLLKLDPIGVFEDVLFSPLAMSTVSEMIELSIRKKPIGLFNLGSRNGMNKAEFAFAFADKLSLLTRALKRTTSEEATFLKAYRPKDMRMNCTKLENALGVELPTLADEIAAVAEEYYENA